MEGATLAHAVADDGSKEENGTCCDDGAGGGRDRKCARRCRNTRLITIMDAPAPAFGRGGHDRHAATANADGSIAMGGCDGLAARLGGFVVSSSILHLFSVPGIFLPFSALGLATCKPSEKNERMMCWD